MNTKDKIKIIVFSFNFIALVTAIFVFLNFPEMRMPVTIAALLYLVGALAGTFLILPILDRDVLAPLSEKERQSARYQSLLDSVPDGLVSTDDKGRIIFMNKEMERMLDTTFEELNGKVFTDVVHLEDMAGNSIESNNNIIAKSLLGSSFSTPFFVPYFFIRKDGTKLPFIASGAPVIVNGKVTGVTALFRDATIEQEIDKAKNEFVTLASHQLRTPPTAVKWYTESLLSHPANLDEKQKKYLHEIYRSNKRMINLVNSLLNVSRVELGTFVVDTSPTDLRDGVRVVLEELLPTIKEKKLQIYKKFEEPLPLISVDPRLVIIILQNLISNAIKYTPERGTIIIGLGVNPERDMVITVNDTGCGIPAAQQKRIFTKLFRADNANDYDPDGSGLGLYITKSIIDQTGGKIWFDSVEGNGTAFHVSYPLDKGMKGKKGTQNLI